MLVLMKIRMVLLMKRVVCKRRRHPSREMPPYAAHSPATHQHPCHYTGTRHTNNYPTWCSERMIMTRLPHVITLPWHFPFRPPSSMTVGHIIKASLLLPKARYQTFCELLESGRAKVCVKTRVNLCNHRKVNKRNIAKPYRYGEGKKEQFCETANWKFSTK